MHYLQLYRLWHCLTPRLHSLLGWIPNHAKKTTTCYSNLARRKHFIYHLILLFIEKIKDFKVQTHPLSSWQQKHVISIFDTSFDRRTNPMLMISKRCANVQVWQKSVKAVSQIFKFSNPYHFTTIRFLPVSRFCSL